MIIERAAIIEGLMAGKILVIDRRDSPALPIVMDLQSIGLVETQIEQIDEQSSVLRVRWKKNE